MFRSLKLIVLSFAMLGSNATIASFQPPQSLSPQGDNVILNETFQDEAWMVYTYQINERGVVVNAEIHSSNGVEAVEQEVLKQVKGLTFTPAINNGEAVRVEADPVVFTWVIDQPREMSAEFSKTYKAAQTFVGMERFDEAFDELAKLKSHRGRNVYEEVKFQTLAATLADRWDDEAAELQHLSRVIELQTLADYKRFEHPYVAPADYALLLERVLILQLDRMMLADAYDTLGKINDLDAKSEIALRASNRFNSVAARFDAIPDVTIEGELLPMYRSGPGTWIVGLSRTKFSVSDVKGSIDAVFLSCNRGEIRLNYPSSIPWNSPRGWKDCKIDVSGKVGSRLKIHQLAQ